jgi:lysophospholipase L1-like esterase
MKKKVVRLASDSFSRWPLLGLWLGLMIASGPRSGSAASHPPNEHPRTQAILVLGDSLSAGYGLERREAYPALLWKKAADAGFNVMVMNAAVSGGTTAGGLRRLPGLLRRHHINVLVVELGINDLFGGASASVVPFRPTLEGMGTAGVQRSPSRRVRKTSQRPPVAQ